MEKKMTQNQKQQYQALVEGLMGIRPLNTKHLHGRMELQRWILREVQFFFPEANLVDVVRDIISPAVQTQYPH